ncbi:hypothetical protein HPB50_018334 [Hyalomma asiaticum]|uniref:Uncharacterized protein n=1 Tax=Hyalomma asiaticum TaxID=266040 RepID=A0ACB7RJV9_HYAAI|nr:hypothetical protein HPB50_018334 [Hyalomma asiaticum]
MSRVGREVLYQVSDHAVLGVNWRPMRLVDEVPREHVCDHCHVIPRRTSLLPCKHALCDLCREGSTSVGSTVCPVCKQSCGEEGVKEVLLPERISSSLKAHCWNEEKGCEFVGTVETLLQHYEEACEFRSFQCTVSGETVLLKDLPAHCDNGECVATGEASASSSDANVVSTLDAALSVDDIRREQEETEKRILELHSTYLICHASSDRDSSRDVGEANSEA